MRTKDRILCTACGLVGGAVGTLFTQPADPPVIVVVATTLIGAIIGVLGVHFMLFILGIVLRQRSVTPYGLMITLMVACAAGALPVYWASRGRMLPTAIGAATLLAPVVIWLSAREGFTTSLRQASKIGWRFPVTLLAMLLAGTLGIYVGLMAWLIPLMAVKSLNVAALMFPALCVGVFAGCLAGAAIGIAIGVLPSRAATYLTPGQRGSRRRFRTWHIIALATGIGIASQVLIIIYLRINPPSSIQGPGPFMPPFALAAAAAALLVSFRSLPSNELKRQDAAAPFAHEDGT